MIKHYIILPIVLFFGVACSRQEDIRGTFVNDASEEISIDCDYHIRSTHLSGEPFMPVNNDKIELGTSSLKAEEIVLSFN